MQRDGWKLDFSTSREGNLGQTNVLGDIVTFITYVLYLMMTLVNMKASVISMPYLRIRLKPDLFSLLKADKIQNENPTVLLSGTGNY